MSLLRLALWRAVLLGLISAVLMVIAITLLGEIWNGRTIALVAIWLLGGIFGALSGVAVLLLAHKLFGARGTGWLRAIIFLPAFILAGAMVFYIQTGWQSGFEPHPEHPIRSILFGSVQVMALFVYSLSHYMLPWMAPAMMMAGYALMPRVDPLTPQPPKA